MLSYVQGENWSMGEGFQAFLQRQRRLGKLRRTLVKAEEEMKEVGDGIEPSDWASMRRVCPGLARNLGEAPTIVIDPVELVMSIGPDPPLPPPVVFPPHITTPFSTPPVQLPISQPSSIPSFPMYLDLSPLGTPIPSLPSLSGPPLPSLPVSPGIPASLPGMLSMPEQWSPLPLAGPSVPAGPIVDPELHQQLKQQVEEQRTEVGRLEALVSGHQAEKVAMEKQLDELRRKV